MRTDKSGLYSWARYPGPAELWVILAVLLAGPCNMADFIDSEAKGKEKSNRKRKAPRDHKAESKARAKRFRNWVFTLNNPEKWGFPRFMKDSMIWLRYGEEIAPTTQTPHLQGVIHFKSKRVMPRDLYDWTKHAHWEHMGGSIASNLSYTGKEASVEAGTLHEFGVRPLSNKEAREKGNVANQERYREIIARAKAGDFAYIETEHPRDSLWMQRNLERVWHKAHGRPARLDRLTNWWVWGETGCGKTKAVWDLVGEDKLYSKDASNKWWDHYEYQEWVLLDDFNPLWKDKACLKNWGDHYPFPAEVKGGVMQIRPKHMIITANMCIDDAHFELHDLEPIKRRFTECSVSEFIEQFNKLMAE